jgi:DNA-binding CsgD family transcriptional regulator
MAWYHESTLPNVAAWHERGHPRPAPHVLECASITQRQRTILELRWQGKTYGEIAAILGSTYAAVAAHAHKARRRICGPRTRREMQNRGYWPVYSETLQ